MNKKRKKKPRRLLTKNIRKALQKQVERLWIDYVKKRDKHCKLCRNTEGLQTHHIFSRTNKNIFIDVDNGVTLCEFHHCQVTFHDSAKETLRRKIDPATYERLYEQSLEKGAFLDWKDITWLEWQIKILEERIKDL